MKWIRLWTEETKQSTTFQELNCAERGVWFSLLILAGANIRHPGIIEIRDGVGYTPPTLSELLNCPLDELEHALTHLVNVGKIERMSDNRLKISNFNRYQTRFERYYKSGIKDGIKSGSRKGISMQGRLDVDGDKKKNNIYSLQEQKERIVNLWNRLAIHDRKSGKKTLVHTISNSKLFSVLEQRLAEHGYKVTRQAVWNYRQMLHDPDRFFFQYRWNLYEFLVRGKDNVARFKDWDVVCHNFTKRGYEEPQEDWRH